MSDIKHWALAFEDLKLTDPEKAIVKRLIDTPRSRSFLPAAEILKKYGKTGECIELLTIGLEWHPSYSAARVTLARELFNQGMMEESWELLHRSGDYLGGNFVAQKLRLKIAIVLGQETDARAICENMVQGGIIDNEVELINENLQSIRFTKVRDELVRQLEERGIRILPLGAPKHPQPSDLSASHAIDDGLERTKGFYVAPVRQIFARIVQDGPQDEMPGGELDTITLAELYERQGHYSKALEIYRRLASMSTQNEMFRRKIAEIMARKHEQKEADLKVDPKVVEQIQKCEVFDQKISYLHRLLDRLD